MPAVPKSRAVGALLLLLMMAPLRNSRPADVPIRKSPATPLEESEVSPRRLPRPLSRREIFQAIQDDLVQMGFSARRELGPQDLIIQASVPVLESDMGLQVKRISFDPIRGELAFELWASHEPGYLPFKVTTRRDPQSLGLSPRPDWKLGEAGMESRRGSPAIGPHLSRAPSKPLVLAKPGRPAALVMLAQLSQLGGFSGEMRRCDRDNS